MNNWHSRYKAFKKSMGYTNSDIAHITGNTPDSVKGTTQKNRPFPRWARLAIVVFERLSNKEEK